MMNILSNKLNENLAIAATLQHYIDGAKSGSSEMMRPAFHKDATVFGYIGDDLFAGAIEKLFVWNDNNGPAPYLEVRIAYTDVVNTTATVRVELENWSGHRFTDLFTLLKVDGKWQIMNKVFHLHS